MAIETDRQCRQVLLDILKAMLIFAEATLELKGSIQYIRKRKFIEIVSLEKHLNITTFMLKGTFFLKIMSGSIQCLIQKMFLGGSR